MPNALAEGSQAPQIIAIPPLTCRVAPVTQPLSIPDGSQLPGNGSSPVVADPISGGTVADQFSILPDPIPQHPLEQAIPIDFHKAIDEVFSSPEIAVA